jgi:hypothetical protein
MELRVLLAVFFSIQVLVCNYDEIRGITIPLWESMGKAISEWKAR